jgi:phosphomannomutase
VADFDRLVKAYDVRGTVPDEMNAGIARDVGALFVRLTGTRRLAVARDMRDSFPALAAALAEGATAAGADELAFSGLKLVPPGVTLVSDWRPSGNGVRPAPHEVNFYGGVARKP